MTSITYWDNEFQVNSTLNPAGYDFTNGSMAALPDGRIIVVWRGDGLAGDGDSSGIQARILYPDGSPTGSTFTVNSTTTGGQDAATVTVLTDGRFVITWHSEDDGDGGSPNLDSNLTIRARVFESDGTPSLYNGSTQDFVVNDVPGFNDVFPVVAPLAAGGFVIVWQAPSAPFGDHDIVARRFTSTGPESGQVMLDPAGGLHSLDPAITVLADGKYVVGWDEGNNVYARVFNPDGTPAASGGSVFVLTTTTQGNQNDVSLAALPDGRFVATWRTDDFNSSGASDGSSAGIRARVFLADGTADPAVNGGNDFLVNTTTNSVQEHPDVIATADGHFLFTFSSRSDIDNVSSNLSVIARLFNADGTPFGPDFLVAHGGFGGGNVASNALLRMPDGRVLVLYDELATTPDRIIGRFIDFSDNPVTLNGDGADNILIGTAHSDTLNGGDGADTLYGGAGADILNGGPGNDTLRGGFGGSSVLNGGTGNDTMYARGVLAEVILAPGDGADTVYEFNEGVGVEDRLNLTAYTNLHALADVLAIATQAGADTFINFGAGDTVTLIGVTRDNLVDDDFIFASAPPANDPPFVSSPIADQSVAKNTAWSFQVPANTFVDPNGDALSYVAALGNGDPLPGWLSFNPATQTFSGTPPQDFEGVLALRVTASDGAASTFDTFDLISLDVGETPRTVHWAASVDVGSHPAGWVTAGIADFNGDGTSDLAWYNPSSGNIDIWKLSNGRWAGSSDVGTHPAGYQPVGFGDFNHDGTGDVLWYNSTTRDVDLWKIASGQWAGSVGTGTHPAGWQPALTGDFNGDGTSDIAWYNPSTGGIDLWKISNGQWAGSVDVGTHPAGWQPTLAGDFNGDGTSDIAWYNPSTGGIDIWKMSNGQWAGSVDVGTHPAGWQPLGAADFNKDGTSDIVWYNPTTNNIDVWLMNNGQWAGSVDPGTHPAGAVAVGVGDFDHNGVSDIMWRDTTTGHIDNWMLAYS